MLLVFSIIYDKKKFKMLNLINCGQTILTIVFGALLGATISYFLTLEYQCNTDTGYFLMRLI